jgi:hypothetical protein
MVSVYSLALSLPPSLYALNCISGNLHAPYKSLLIAGAVPIGIRNTDLG